MAKYKTVFSIFTTSLFIILILAGLYATSLYNFLLFHSLAEIFSIVIAFSIFILAWNTRQFLDNNYLLFLGISYLFIAGIDLIHTLAYKGMNIFPGYNANLPTQLWIVARYLESLSFLLALLWIRRKINHQLVLLVYTLITIILFLSIFSWDIFPVCYIEGSGLTPFKIISEYIISVILLSAMLVLWKKHNEFDTRVLHFLLASLVFTIGSELAFTFYISVYGFSNFIGHIFKIVSFYCIYKALVEVGLSQPLELLFRNLQQSETRYKQLSVHLEEKVEERTKELLEAQEQLIRQEKLAIIGQFAGSLSHELRNPLGVIQNAIYYLKIVLATQDAEIIEYLQIIDNQSKNIVKLITDMLDFARTKSPQKESVEVLSLINGVFIQHTPPQNISIRLDISENLPHILIDPHQIQQVIANRVINAYQSMPQGGQLSISATEKLTNGASPSDNSSIESNKMEIRISDTGKGIAPEYMQKIFMPLFTTKTKGTGLGLLTCKNLVEANGGKIKVDSLYGEGTTITITLPVHEDDQ